MATDVMMPDRIVNHETREYSIWNGVKHVLEPVASLKLTVVLFALSIFLILAGTLAQVDKDIWDVISLYFRVWIAWVPLQVLFPPVFSPDPTNPVTLSGGFWFPGGKLLGLLLAVNLLSAHIVRFKAVATGNRLYLGIVTIIFGCSATWAIIAAGGNSKGIQNDPLIPYRTQWIGYQGLLAFGALVALYAFTRMLRQPIPKSDQKRIRKIFLQGVVAFIGLVFSGLLAFTLSRGEAGRPGNESLRILWQLTQGTVAAIALLQGCRIVFGQRAGIVLLHAGIGLMMFYELHVALTAIETQMRLAEGERTNYVQDIRTFELAVIDTTDPKEDRVVAIPKSIFLSGKTVDDPDLPFKIDVKNYMQNSRVRSAEKSDVNPATSGIGRHAIPEERKPNSGTDSDGGIDMPAAYVTLTSRADGSSIGTYLVSLFLSMTDQSDTVRVGDKNYSLELRPKRYYKSYVFELKDVRKEDYLGTNTPRSYASTVHIVDPTRNVDEEKTIWMNNPLRFADETFYQSGYQLDEKTGVEHTTLSVVANSGWMMPYVGCMLVGVGMLVHFLNLLFRFLTKDDAPDLSPNETARASELAAKLGMKVNAPIVSPTTAAMESRFSATRSYLFTAIVMTCAIIYVAKASTPPAQKLLSFDLYRFGQIPVVSQGRVKPIDSAASSALLEISGKTSIRLDDEYQKMSRFQKMFGLNQDQWKVPATKWLLEVIAETKIANQREIFRVENLELQEILGVKKREGMRYMPNELRNHLDELERQTKLARKQARDDKNQLSVFQKKVLELNEKFMIFGNLKWAFGLQNQIGGKTEDEIRESFLRVVEISEQMETDGQSVLFAVGPTEPDKKWHTLARAWVLDLENRFRKNGSEDKSVLAWEQLLKAYYEDKPAAFNKAVDDLLKLVEDNPPYLDQTGQAPPRQMKPWIVRLESYINYVQPFTHASVLYLVAFIMGAVGWLTWPRGFNRAAFGLLLVAFVVHTLALWARLVISGRPPVTNLYSSAIFIGWGCVLFGLMFEIVFRIGIGNLVAAVAGYATLLIADGLAADGDTFTVLQAVLDTQFWLATHVTCITLGYATTYFAGLFGVAYILLGACTPSLTAQNAKDINRMIYGMLCFSIFFSFIGTVLGGLWADDSWGRFWGWDPKENAALIIVLWNALALHARWGGMVKERGLACLAVGGNIFVSWSWWGVNALGAGLHTYGFKQGTLLKLGIFILVNLAIIGIGMMPKNYWLSVRNRTELATD